MPHRSRVAALARRAAQLLVEGLIHVGQAMYPQAMPPAWEEPPPPPPPSPPVALTRAERAAWRRLVRAAERS